MTSTNPQLRIVSSTGLEVISALLLLNGALGCRDVLGVESTTLDVKENPSCEPPADLAGAGVGVDWWSGCGDPSVCFSARKPGPTDRPSDSAEGDDIAPITIAFDRVLLGARNTDGALDAEAWKSMGFDLDGLCTASPTCASGTTDADRACKPQLGTPAPDGEHCRDNQLGLLDYNLDTLPQTSGKYMATSAQLNCALCRGGYNLMVRISGYNGNLDDPSVRVDFYPSPGLGVLKDLDCSQDTWDESACWGSTDPFTIDRAFLENPSALGEIGPATFYDPSAFVRKGWLVVQLPDNTPFGLVSQYPATEISPAVRIAIQGGILVAKLQKSSSGWTVPSGLLGGSTRMSAFVDEFARLGLCDKTDATAAVLVRTFLQSSADLLSTGAVSPNTPCDALSLGLYITGREATIGALVSVAVPTSPDCMP
jgi:hypothetical protein